MICVSRERLLFRAIETKANEANSQFRNNAFV